ncbi:MAG TPA: hypothetical protein VKG84_10360, partial [Candidatus Acidoferrales bacterium]|nr:hypothetical protein [Candidatus Acidoferrales bacterium]
QAVRLYLPRANRDDIIRELSANLLSQMEERESALGRPLSEDEQMALLKQHGDPMLVARRYRQDRPSLSIGVELIGPELFPMYLIILGLNLSICIIFTALFFLAMKLPLSIEPFVFPVLLQIVCVTTIFIILNLIRRKYPQPWYYPPAAMAPLIPIARWTSISGLVVWLIFTSWWAATPYFPQLVLGSAAKGLELAPVWHTFYTPLLLLLLMGIAQRAVNVARADWTWLLPVSRMLVNLLGLLLQFPIFKGYPYVLVAEWANNQTLYVERADALNNFILWGLVSWLWIYFLISALVYARYCVPHVRRLFSRVHAPAASRA